MAAINEVLASIQNIDDLDKYRESGEKRLRVLRSIVSTLNELSVRDGGIVAARLAEAIDNERKFLVNYAEIMEKAYAKINNDDVDMIADDVEVAAEVEVVAEMEIAAEVEIAADVEVDTDEEADYVNEEVNNQLGLEETFYESDDDTVSNHSGISQSVFDAIRLPPYMLDNVRRRLDLDRPPTPDHIVVSDDSDSEAEDEGEPEDETIDVNVVNNWFNQNMDWTIFSNAENPDAMVADRGECVICTDALIEGRIVNLECNHTVCLSCLYNIFHCMDIDVMGYCPFCR